MYTFELKALEESYNFQVGNNVRMQQLEGGRPRKVRKFIGAVHNVTATVLLENDEARQYFWAFWRLNELQQFKWTLAIDQGGVEDCICEFNNDQTPQLQLIGAYVWKATINVFVAPIARSKDTDENVVASYSGAGNGGLFEIEKIPNVYFPEATGIE